MKPDNLAKSLKMCFRVIPAQTGIQYPVFKKLTNNLNSGFDQSETFYETIKSALRFKFPNSFMDIFRKS